MLPLPPKIDPSVTMMQVEERPSITYADVGGCKEQIEKLREVVELPLLEVSSRAYLSRGVAICADQFSSLSDLSASVLNPPRVSFSMVLQVPVKLSVPEPSPTEPTQPLYVSSVPNLCKSTLVKVPEWCENFSRWLDRKRRVSSSLMKSMQLVVRGLMTVLVETMRCSGPCWS